MNEFSFNPRPINPGFNMNYGYNPNAAAAAPMGGMHLWGTPDGYSMLPDLSATAEALPPPNIMSNFLQQKRADGSTTGGYGQAALQTFSGLTNAWLGMQQYNMAKDALKENKRQFNLNYGAQSKAYNEQLESRQVARLGQSEGQGYTSVGETMRKYGV